jgi:ferric-dicitrate binding protein FerR (iron transport regulator)
VKDRDEPAARHRRQRAGERGQASVELVALLPVLVVIAIAGAQALAVGYSAVLAGNAAEAAALALAGGGDPESAARSALPGWSRGQVQVAVKGGHVRVSVRPPALFSPLARELEVTAEAGVEAP